MKLLTKKLESTIPALESQDGLGGNAIVHAKFFHAMSNYTLYALEYDPTDRIFFGIVTSHECEYGNVSLTEMEEVNVYGLPMERDLWFQPTMVKHLTDPSIKDWMKEEPRAAM